MALLPPNTPTPPICILIVGEKQGFAFLVYYSPHTPLFSLAYISSPSMVFLFFMGGEPIQEQMTQTFSDDND